MHAKCLTYLFRRELIFPNISARNAGIVPKSQTAGFRKQALPKQTESAE